jgi:hypothetical protein
MAPSFYSSHPTITTHHLDAENPPQPLDHFQLKWIQAIRILYKKEKPSSSITLNFSPFSLFFCISLKLSLSIAATKLSYKSFSPSLSLFKNQKI